MDEYEKLENKATVSERQIDELISTGQRRHARAAQKLLSQEALLSITFCMDEMLAAVERIVEYPSQFAVDAFKDSCTDPLIKIALNDPYVSLALELKQAHDIDRLPLLAQLASFRHSRKIEVPQDAIMKKFTADVKHYLPPLPIIRDEQLFNDVFEGEGQTEDLYAVGQAKFLSEVSDLLNLRFSQQEVLKDAVVYIGSRAVTSTWAKLYELVDPLNEESEEDGQQSPDHVFYAYIGALSLSNVTEKDEAELRKLIMVLIEPLAKQFGEVEFVGETAKDKLSAHIQGATYELIHTSTHERDLNKTYIVQACVGDNVVIGWSSGVTLADAENRAANVVLENKPHLDRTIAKIAAIQYETPQQYDHQSYERPSSINQQQQPHTQPHQATGFPPVAPPPASTGLLSSMAYQNSTPAMNTINMSSMDLTVRAPPPPPVLINEEFQRQRQEATEAISLAPQVPDEQIDISSKQMLNELLIEFRYSAAEYKTAKLSNSDVQVTCFIENIAIARAISNNKKKAGHICAGYILNNWNTFLQKLPPRH